MFSVIIPCYNSSEHIARCLDSLVSQTYQKFEVIICDDGSLDKTIDIVNEYIPYLEISLLSQENSGGPASPRNMAVQSARYDYLAFLDSDDWWHPDKLEVCSLYAGSQTFCIISLNFLLKLIQS